MKVKKQRRHRRIVTFYKTCFGFRQPFKVLLDGTFIYHLLVNNILAATVKLYTTRCEHERRAWMPASWRLLEKIILTASLLLVKTLICVRNSKRYLVCLSYVVSGQHSFLNLYLNFSCNMPEFLKKHDCI